MYSRRQLLVAAMAVSAASLARCSYAFARQTLSIAHAENSPPFCYLSDSKAQGLFIDILDSVLITSLGMHVSHHFYPWARAQQLVREGKHDALCTVPTAERAIFAEIAAEPIVISPFRLFYRADHPQADLLSQVTSSIELRAMKLKVVTFNGNGWSAAKLSGVPTEFGKDLESAFRMLIGKRGDVLVANAVMAKQAIRSIPQGQHIVMAQANVDTVSYALLIGKQSPHVNIIRPFNAAMRLFRGGPVYAAILKKYDIDTI